MAGVPRNRRNSAVHASWYRSFALSSATGEPVALAAAGTRAGHLRRHRLIASLIGQAERWLPQDVHDVRAAFPRCLVTPPISGGSHCGSAAWALGRVMDAPWSRPWGIHHRIRVSGLAGVRGAAHGTGQRGGRGP